MSLEQKVRKTQLVESKIRFSTCCTPLFLFSTEKNPSKTTVNKHDKHLEAQDRRYFCLYLICKSKR